MDTGELRLPLFPEPAEAAPSWGPVGYAGAEEYPAGGWAAQGYPGFGGVPAGPEGSVPPESYTWAPHPQGYPFHDGLRDEFREGWHGQSD
ncbi:hypothetical protein [Streptomyces sp. NPDC093261]|uniref:hypothetical protein n=1 Tax=Streptomyces sp. NPDC093261 TaxID=3366037 RepID=UPI00381E2004